MQLQKLKTLRRLSIRMTSGLCERGFFSFRMDWFNLQEIKISPPWEK